MDTFYRNHHHYHQHHSSSPFELRVHGNRGTLFLNSILFNFFLLISLLYKIYIFDITIDPIKEKLSFTVKNKSENKKNGSASVFDGTKQWRDSSVFSPRGLSRYGASKRPNRSRGGRRLGRRRPAQCMREPARFSHPSYPWSKLQSSQGRRTPESFLVKQRVKCSSMCCFRAAQRKYAWF